jgi:N-formylglutamate deformylase
MQAPSTPVVVTRPPGRALPIVIDSPHSGMQYPADFGASLPLATLRGGEDTWVDQMYALAPSLGATLIAAQFPRVYIDPNRSLHDID